MRTDLLGVQMPGAAAVFDRKVQDREENQGGEKDRDADQKPIQTIHTRRNGRCLLWEETEQGLHTACYPPSGMPALLRRSRRSMMPIHVPMATMVATPARRRVRRMARLYVPLWGS